MSRLVVFGSLVFALGQAACGTPPPPPTPVQLHLQSTYTERCLASTPTGLATVQCTTTGEQRLEVRLTSTRTAPTLCWVGTTECLSDVSASFDPVAERILIRDGGDYRCLAIRSSRGDTTLEHCSASASNQRWIAL